MNEEASEERSMTEPIRIPPEEVRKKVQAHEALFVCAYDDAEKFRRMHLEGGISFAEFKAKAESLPRDREIIFYCA
jgi:rhodanese-related sulfurtransferase